jgi:hypothetical protein
VSTCRSCGVEIVWTETEAKPDKPGRKMPLTAEPGTGKAKVVANGNIRYTGATSGDGTPIVRYVPKAAGMHVSHFSDCPNADKHRRR